MSFISDQSHFKVHYNLVCISYVHYCIAVFRIVLTSVPESQNKIISPVGRENTSDKQLITITVTSMG